MIVVGVMVTVVVIVIVIVIVRVIVIILFTEERLAEWSSHMLFTASIKFAGRQPCDWL